MKFHSLPRAKQSKLFDTTSPVWLPKLRQNSANQRTIRGNWVPVNPAFLVCEVSDEVQASDSFRCDFQFPDGFRTAVRAPREFRLRHVEISAHESDRYEIRVQQSSYADLFRCHGRQRRSRTLGRRDNQSSHVERGWVEQR